MDDSNTAWREELSPQAALTTAASGSYWRRAASRYTIAHRVLLAVLVLFVILFFTIAARRVSYAGLLAFTRDLGALSALAAADPDTVTYSAGDSFTACAFRGGVAVSDAGGLSIYASDGRLLHRTAHGYRDPRMAASRRYLLSYDWGGTSFSVCNAYDELFRGETDAPIYFAAVSDAGQFALVTASDEALSQVLLYDGNFNLVQRFRRATATVGVALSENGSRIALLGADATGGASAAVLDLFRVGHTEPEATWRREGEFPYAVGFTTAKRLMVLTDRTLTAVESNGRAEELFRAGADEPVLCRMNEAGALLVTEADATNEIQRVLVYDKRGKLRVDTTFTGRVTCAALTEDAAFLLSAAGVTRLRTEDGARSDAPCAPGASSMWAEDASTVRLAYTGETVGLRFDD